MKRWVVAAAIAAAPAVVGAQGASSGATSVARKAAGVWNDSATTRVNGRFDLGAGKVVERSVAVINGPVAIAGTIRGSLVAINADVQLAAGARIERDLIVVGGSITGADGASLGGEISQQAELVRFRLDKEALELEREPEYDDSWWRRRHVSRALTTGVARSEFFYVASRTYNRVEGWSIAAGPRFQRPTSWGAVNVELFGVVRTAKPIRWDEETLGHDAKAELLFGKPIGVAIGGHAFDLVAPTESWQLGEDEVGLAAAFLRADFRDYYVRHGGDVFMRLVAGKDVDLTFALSDEQWSNRGARTPWALSHDADSWRPNPTMDFGSVHLLTTTLRVDTRERERSPFGGWYLAAELEQGGGRITRAGAPIATLTPFAPPSPEPVWYSRAFIDMRRYTQVAPGLSVDLRLAGGGWVAGDALPTQRRLGIGGPGTLPGYAFRSTTTAPDLLSCTSGFVQDGTPAQCDRVALAQMQIRSRFLFSAWRTDVNDDWWRPGFNHNTAWVLFADAGRGWNVSSDGSASAMTAPRGELPPLSSFKTDLGAGIDFGDFGVYWAKPLKDGDAPGRWIVRLQRRF